MIPGSVYIAFRVRSCFEFIADMLSQNDIITTYFLKLNEPVEKPVFRQIVMGSSYLAFGLLDDWFIAIF